MEQANEQDQHLQDKLNELSDQSDLIEEHYLTSDNDVVTDAESDDGQVATALTYNEHDGLASDIGEDDGTDATEEDDDELDMDAMLKQANLHYLGKQTQSQENQQTASSSLHHDGPCGFAASLEQLERQSQHLVRGDIKELRERLEQLESRQDTLDMKLNMVTEVLSNSNLIKHEDQRSLMSDIESEQAASIPDNDAENPMQQCEHKCVSDKILGSSVLDNKQIDFGANHGAASEGGSSTSYQSSASDISSAGF